MIAEGLLWFDDDPRRPLVEKIADAVERFSERTGWRPTICEANPSQVEAFEAAKARSGKARKPTAAAAPQIELPPKLRVVASAAMLPNHFLIGIAAGETPRRAATPVRGHAGARRVKAVEPAQPAQPAPRHRAPRAKAS